ncbi:hypothetical protein [Phyllobacterium sp. P30BS-XVII]|uniref:hypothetical protein n=1 Tax=Phyllobacterium sp. P30BS-XVII TaxID=2587046 RepID=UPI0013AF9165|nr:hypothetical protein [Phyllobacterium sp. P30BS-XVII]MBA8903890.1 hypothetical protein [Phyllobacterium sp. P30BS-XVII]
MKLSSRMIKDYPNLSKWISENIPKTKYNTKIFKAFMRHSQLSEAAANSALTLGSLPTIDCRAMVQTPQKRKPGHMLNGQFDHRYKNTVFIALSVCDSIEKSGIYEDPETMRLMIERTVLHEMVHWGDLKDGTSLPGEAGREFEKEAYGGRLVPIF